VARSDSPKDSVSDSSKKVAKAAKAGATPSANVGREQRSLGFPMAFLAICVLGTALVVFAWSGRDVEALSPSFNDHWHLSYGIYDCRDESFAAPLADPQTSNSGIHTHGQGVIHIHPYSSTATGNAATLGTFFEAVNETLDDDELTFPDRDALTEDGATCDGEDAILHAARFEPGATEPIEVLTEDLSSLRFRADQEAIVIALVPADADIPLPPDGAVEQARAASPNILRTDGLQDLPSELESNNLGGFNPEGVLVDSEGNPILDAEGNEITQQSIQLQAEADAEAEGDSTDDESGNDEPAADDESTEEGDG